MKTRISFPDGREVDQYDGYPHTHLVTHRATLNAGRLRAYGSNVDGRDARYCRSRSMWRKRGSRLHQFPESDRSTVCEISRLAVDGAFRRRGAKERLTRFGQVDDIDFSTEEKADSAIDRCFRVSCSHRNYRERPDTRTCLR